VERVPTRRWASKSSWRLTFTVWSVVLVVWAAVTLLIDYDTLLAIRELVRGRAPIAVLAAIIAIPVLVDATRNFTRQWAARQRHAGRARASEVTSWGTVVPATTPRQFRGDARSELTWRERAIVEQGQLAYGIVHHHGELSSVRFEAPWGDVIGSRPVRAVKPRPREGSPAPLLFEPGALVGVAPTLLGLELERSEPPDLRRELEVAPLGEAPASLTTALLPTLHPVERMSRYRTMDVGMLELGDGRLSLAPSAGDPVTVRLDQPFRVEAKTHLLDPERAELVLRIEPRTNTAYRAGNAAPLVLKTELPQRRIDRGVPIGWCDACYVSPDDFDALWCAIVSAADDDELTRAVTPT
jgi:hypothetical protein